MSCLFQRTCTHIEEGRMGKTGEEEGMEKTGEEEGRWVTYLDPLSLSLIIVTIHM